MAGGRARTPMASTNRTREKSPSGSPLLEGPTTGSSRSDAFASLSASAHHHRSGGHRRRERPDLFVCRGCAPEGEADQRHQDHLFHCRCPRAARPMNGRSSTRARAWKAREGNAFFAAGAAKPILGRSALPGRCAKSAIPIRVRPGPKRTRASSQDVPEIPFRRITTERATSMSQPG